MKGSKKTRKKQGKTPNTGSGPAKVVGEVQKTTYCGQAFNGLTFEMQGGVKKTRGGGHFHVKTHGTLGRGRSSRAADWPVFAVTRNWLRKDGENSQNNKRKMRKDRKIEAKKKEPPLEEDEAKVSSPQLKLKKKG